MIDPCRPLSPAENSVEQLQRSRNKVQRNGNVPSEGVSRRASRVFSKLSLLAMRLATRDLSVRLPGISAVFARAQGPHDTARTGSDPDLRMERIIPDNPVTGGVLRDQRQTFIDL